MKLEMKKRIGENKYFRTDLVTDGSTDYVRKVLNSEYLYLKKEFLDCAEKIKDSNIPGVLKIHEISLEDDDHVLYVREYCRGKTIYELLEHGELSEGECLEYLSQSVKILSIMAGKSIFHLGLSPGNIFVTDDSEVKITDILGSGFLSKISGSKNVPEDTGSTFIPEKEKEYSWYSPERIINNAENLDEKSDIYSLGVIFYYALHGRLPFDAINRSEKIEIDEKISPETGALIIKMISSDRKDRFSGYDELFEEIERIKPEKTGVPLAAYRLIGKKFENGNLEITECIAAGGMGWVFRGLQHNPEREVAIKVLSPSLRDDRSFIKQFKREANEQGKLQSAHIVPIINVGLDNEIPYIVMQMMTGTLHSRLREGKQVTEKESLEITVGILRGLKVAHGRGLIHQDIKPANVFFDDDGYVRIGDFGLVRAAEHSIAVTRTIGICGTPHYMSPEQFDRKLRENGKLDGRTDIYATGIILFEILAGEKPFDGDSISAVQYQQVNESLPMEKLKDCSRMLVSIIERACAKKPSDRYQNAGEMIEDIELFLKGEEPKAFNAYSEKENLAKKEEARKLYSRALEHLDSKEVDEAERLLAKVLELDPEHERARERLEKLVGLQATKEKIESSDLVEDTIQESNSFSKIMVFMFLILFFLAGAYYFKDQIFPKKEIKNIVGADSKSARNNNKNTKIIDLTPDKRNVGADFTAVRKPVDVKKVDLDPNKNNVGADSKSAQTSIKLKEKQLSEKYSLALSKYQSGKYSDARRMFEEVKLLDSNYRDVNEFIAKCDNKIKIKNLLLDGESKLVLGNFSDARSKFEEILKIEKNNPEANEKLSIIKEKEDENNRKQKAEEKRLADLATKEAEIKRLADQAAKEVERKRIAREDKISELEAKSETLYKNGSFKKLNTVLDALLTLDSLNNIGTSVKKKLDMIKEAESFLKSGKVSAARAKSDELLSDVPDDPHVSGLKKKILKVEDYNSYFKKKYGFLSVSSTPSGAKVYYVATGRSKGEYLGKTPINEKKLKVGSGKIKYALSGYKEKWRDVTIVSLQVEKVRAELTKKKISVSSNMVFVKGGSFKMGSPESEKDCSSDEGPVHTVTVDSFYMGKYEVTQKEWKAVMGNNPSRFKGDNLPVEKVSWFDAVKFCNKKSKQEGKTACYTINGENVTCNWNANGYRLPTEAEWEYACRGGTTTPFHYGNRLDSTMANFDGRYPYGGASKGVYRGKTTQVGSFRPNAFGLYDMHGNVYEWCWDWYDSKYYKNSTRTNPRGPGKNSNRVLRGGRWFNYARYCRSAARSPTARIFATTTMVSAWCSSRSHLKVIQALSMSYISCLNGMNVVQGTQHKVNGEKTTSNGGEAPKNFKEM